LAAFRIDGVLHVSFAIMDFDLTRYSPIRDALLPDGIQCGINSRHQISVSTQDGPIWPDRGNSFWITCAPGDWFIFPWYSNGYALPDASRLVELCRRCMKIGDSAMYSIPDEVIAEFALRPLTENEAEAVHNAMNTAK
jgi:hypothetical protein